MRMVSVPIPSFTRDEAPGGEDRRPVIVLTGAASGIARATALEFAGRGARLVLASRRLGALEALAAECRAGGEYEALPFAVDVTDEGAVHALARFAEESFGGIDVWVNCAAVTLYGAFDQTPSAAFNRVIETNVIGLANGCRAALPVMKRRGRGVIINVASVAGALAQPYTAPYVASKWAVRGFSQSLRLELKQDGDSDIQVCTVLPASMDTPIFQNAANYSGRRARPMPPVYEATDVARAIVRLSEKPKPEQYVGGIGPVMALQRAVSPRLTDALMARLTRRGQFEDEPQPPTPGNIWEPLRGHEQVSGGWRTGQSGRVVAGLGAGLAVAAAGIAGWQLRRHAA